MSSPSVLVITPTLGERPAELAESVASLDLQSVTTRRVIVAPAGCDLGDVGAAEVIADPGRGLSPAFNAGLAVEAGEDYVYWLNDDDRVLPGGLDRLVAVLEAHPGAPAAVARIQLIGPDGRPIFTLPGGGLAVLLLPWGPGLMMSPGVLYRRSSLVAVGGLAEGLVHAGDLDALLRLSRRGRLAGSRSVVGQFRWHGESLTVALGGPSLAEAEDVRRRFNAGRSRLHGWVYRVWRPLARLATTLAKLVVGRVAGVGRERRP